MLATIDPSFVPKKILVCQLRQLGDVVLATPSVELLAQRFPEAELHFFTEKKCLPLLANNPHIHTVWALDKKKLRTLAHELAWYWHVARQGFDLVVDFQQLPRIRWVVGFSGAKVRLSYHAPWYTRFLYTHTGVPKGGYAAATKASMLEPLGIQWQGQAPRLYVTEREKKAADAYLQALGLTQGQRLLTIDPTHRRSTRRWPLAQYAALMDGLAARYPDIRFLPLWGPGEDKEIRQLEALCACKPAILDASKLLSLREMAAVLARAALHVGNCSAPRHMAVAVGTPTCVALGATSHEWTFPSPLHKSLAAGLACQPCNQNTCPHDFACLKALKPEDMLEACAALLEARPAETILPGTVRQ